MILLSGSIFPFPTLVLTSVFGAGRILHQFGYATIGYGAHAPGFVLASVATFMATGILTVFVIRHLLGVGA